MKEIVIIWNRIKREGGITLVALVVTIILILILASISLNLVLGDHGLITMAKKAKEDYAQSINEDQEMLANLQQAMLSQENGGNANPSDDMPKDVKDALVIDPNAEEDGKKSPYVKYNGMICRVLYDSTSEYGLQIITNDSVEDVILGYDDPQASASEVSYSGSLSMDTNTKKAISSFNKVTTTLNNIAKTHMDKENIAKKARCFGSNPDFTITKKNYTPSSSYNYNKYKLDNLFTCSNDSTSDQNAVKKIGITFSKYIWSARSWCSEATNNMRCIVNLYSISGPDCLVEISSSNNTIKGFSRTGGFCPVFLLNDDVKIESGDGLTADTAYVLTK